MCIHPAADLAGLPKEGGTKDVNLARLRRLAPSHVIVNVDKNRPDTVQVLRGFVPRGVVTHPRSPEDKLPLIAQLAQEFGAAPYRFTQAHREAVQALCPQATVRLVEGELLSRYGPRAAAGLRYLRHPAGYDGAPPWTFTNR